MLSSNHISELDQTNLSRAGQTDIPLMLQQLLVEGKLLEGKWDRKSIKEQELYQYYLNSLSEVQKNLLSLEIQSFSGGLIDELNSFAIWYLSLVTHPSSVPPAILSADLMHAVPNLPAHLEQLRKLKRKPKIERDGSGVGSSALGGWGVHGVFILSILALASSALIATVAGAYYALKRTGIALKNICQGKKIEKSFLQLAGMAGGAYLGVIKGAALGALIGSSVPVIGTALGAIIGAVSCACIAAGVGGYISKQLGRLASWVRHSNDRYVVSKTNATKYDLPGKERRNTYAMLSALRIQKNSSGQKKEYNDLLTALKAQDFNPERPLVTTKENATYRWDGTLWLKLLPQESDQRVASVADSSARFAF